MSDIPVRCTSVFFDALCFYRYCAAMPLHLKLKLWPFRKVQSTANLYQNKGNPNNGSCKAPIAYVEKRHPTNKKAAA